MGNRPINELEADEFTNKCKDYSRGRAYRRYVRRRAIHHKKQLSRKIYGLDWYKHDGMYSKGKIHCSCRMCTYSKFYHLPTVKDEIADEAFKDALNDVE